MDLRKLAVRVLIFVSSGTSSTCLFCVSLEIRSLGGLFGLGGGASTSDRYFVLEVLNTIIYLTSQQINANEDIPRVIFVWWKFL